MTDLQKYEEELFWQFINTDDDDEADELLDELFEVQAALLASGTAVSGQSETMPFEDAN